MSDETTRVLITYIKRQQGATPGETRGLQLRHARKLVDAGVAVFSKPDDKAVKGFSKSDVPWTCAKRIKRVQRGREKISEGSYEEGGPLKRPTKAVTAPAKDKAMKSSAATTK